MVSIKSQIVHNIANYIIAIKCIGMLLYMIVVVS